MSIGTLGQGGHPGNDVDVDRGVRPWLLGPLLLAVLLALAPAASAAERPDRPRGLAEIRADLTQAQLRLWRTGVRSERATERYNRARLHLAQARRRAREATTDVTHARRRLRREQHRIGTAITTTYEEAPAARGLGGLLASAGIDTFEDRSATVIGTTDALGDHEADYQAALILRTVAADRREAARIRAARWTARARRARDAAATSETTAAAQVARLRGERTDLLAELADRQGVSRPVAARRQRARERRALHASLLTWLAGSQSAGIPAGHDLAADSSPGPAPSPPQATDPGPADPPAAMPGASAAVRFATRQLGEPYQWGSAGPDSWDCSGLTMVAWQHGGISLPHSSAAQYAAASPVNVNQLRPGDLVFWASSASPSSIFHVALYVGDGQIIHAPRTGRNVTRESMYYWVAPTFFARPRP